MAKVMLLTGRKKNLFFLNQKEISYDKAEKMLGRKLDRRRNYYIEDGKLFKSEFVYISCAVCLDEGSWIGDQLREPKGKGCPACGYKGYRHRKMLFPA